MTWTSDSRFSFSMDQKSLYPIFLICLLVLVLGLFLRMWIKMAFKMWLKSGTLKSSMLLHKENKEVSDYSLCRTLHSLGAPTPEQNPWHLPHALTSQGRFLQVGFSNIPIPSILPCKLQVPLYAHTLLFPPSPQQLSRTLKHCLLLHREDQVGTTHPVGHTTL